MRTCRSTSWTAPSQRTCIHPYQPRSLCFGAGGSSPMGSSPRPLWRRAYDPRETVRSRSIDRLEVALNAILLALGPSTPTPMQQRCRAIAEVSARLHSVQGNPTTVIDGPADPVAALAALVGVATVCGDGADLAELRYVPS